MAVMLFGVLWTNQDGVTFVLPNVENITINQKSGTNASKATITLKNPINRLVKGYTTPFTQFNADINQIMFNESDTIKIYGVSTSKVRDLDTSDNSPDLLFTAEIKEIKVRGTNKGSKIVLNCVDKTWVILNKLHVFNYNADTGFTAPQIVQHVIRYMTDDSESNRVAYNSAGEEKTKGKGIYSVDARLVSEGGFIEDTRSDDTAFPSTTMAKVFKPAYEFINELSAMKHTNDFNNGDDEESPAQDRKMKFYVDEKNRFHWFYPKDGVTTTLNGNITATATTITLTLVDNFESFGRVAIGSELIDYTGKSNNDLTGCTRGVNNTTAASHSDGDKVSTAHLFIEGDNSTGNQIINFTLTKKTFDTVNFVIFNAGKDLNGTGILWKYYNKNSKLKELKMIYKPYTEITKELIQSEVNSGNLTKTAAAVGDFTYEGNYYVESGYNLTTGWGTTATSDATYNDQLREEGKAQGEGKSEALTEGTDNPRWKGTIECRFRKYTAGDLINFTSTRAGINALDLRITDLKYNLTKSGGFVTLTVEEDEKKRGT